MEFSRLDHVPQQNFDVIKRKTTMARLQKVFGPNIGDDGNEDNWDSHWDNNSVLKPMEIQADEAATNLYEKAGQLGRDARLMSIAINRAATRLSIQRIGKQVNRQMSIKRAGTFIERRATMKLQNRAMKDMLVPEQAGIEEEKEEIMKARAKAKLVNLSTPMYITNFCVNCPTLVLVVSLIIFTGASLFGYLSGHFVIKDSHYRETYAWNEDAMYEWDMQEAARTSLLE